MPIFLTIMLDQITQLSVKRPADFEARGTKGQARGYYYAVA